MNSAVIALGSNIEPDKNIRKALSQISECFNLIKKSNFVYTKPFGYHKQPDFLNGSVFIETSSDKKGVIRALKEIEIQLGRVKRANKNGPRRIDLDLIIFNGHIVDDDVYEREFLREAIHELLPEVCF